MEKGKKSCTLTLAADGGNVTRINKSSVAGGIRRSPFLTAPFNKIVRAFGPDKSLRKKKDNIFENIFKTKEK